MPKKTGTVIFFDLFKSWGFIHPDDGSPDVFVHADGIESEDHPVLQAGDHVSFWITEAKRGLRALHVRLLPVEEEVEVTEENWHEHLGKQIPNKDRY